MDSVKEKMALRIVKIVHQYDQGMLTEDELGTRINEIMMDYYEELIS